MLIDQKEVSIFMESFLLFLDIEGEDAKVSLFRRAEFNINPKSSQIFLLEELA